LKDTTLFYKLLLGLQFRKKKKNHLSRYLVILS